MFINIVLRRRRSLCPAPALHRRATPEAASPRPHPFLLPRPAVDQVYTIVMILILHGKFLLIKLKYFFSGSVTNNHSTVREARKICGVPINQILDANCWLFLTRSAYGLYGSFVSLLRNTFIFIFMQA